MSDLITDRMSRKKRKPKYYYLVIKILCVIVLVFSIMGIVFIIMLQTSDGEKEIEAGYKHTKLRAVKNYAIYNDTTSTYRSFTNFTTINITCPVKIDKNEYLNESLAIEAANKEFGVNYFYVICVSDRKTCKQKDKCENNKDLLYKQLLSVCGVVISITFCIRGILYGYHTKGYFKRVSSMNVADSTIKVKVNGKGKINRFRGDEGSLNVLKRKDPPVLRL